MKNYSPVMQTVFNTLFNHGYPLQKCREDTFWIILPNNYKIEIFDNGNDCICVGSHNNSYDYQRGEDICAEYVLQHVSTIEQRN
jgi:hypothetical protein